MTVKSIDLPLRVKKMANTAKSFSTSERLFLAKEMLDSLVLDNASNKVVNDDIQEYPHLSLEQIVAQIKSTPPNPRQIQRATQSVDETLTKLASDPTTEPHLTTAEWEARWWLIRQDMKEQNQPNDFAKVFGLKRENWFSNL